MNGHFTVCCSLVSAIVCEDPTLANGVTVLEPHNNVVNSEIFYKCEESGLVPSSNSSLCEEDGMWSPDTSQVTKFSTVYGRLRMGHLHKWSAQYIYVPCTFISEVEIHSSSVA